MMWGFWGNGTWGWLGPLSMLFFWALLIGGIALVLRAWWTPAKPTQTTQSDTALSVLNSRYAKGEITQDEYLRIRQDLLESER